MQRTLREMRILLSLQHENIIDIKDFLCDNSLDSLRDIYIVQVLSNHTTLKLVSYISTFVLVITVFVLAESDGD